jgi:hypothetical protein
MVSRCFVCLLLFLFASCGAIRDWRELRTDPMPIGECYDGIVFVVAKDLVSDTSVSDRGLGIWQSRWRTRYLERNQVARARLRVEIDIDEGSAKAGWPIRYIVEQEKVKDLRRDLDPREEDWSSMEQDKEAEVLIGERLVRKLAPKSLAAPQQERPAS